jgi:maltooligosyltrehalose trehalohydrolase
VLGAAAVRASWRLGNGTVLTIAVNLGRDPVAVEAPPAGRPLFESAAGVGADLQRGCLPARTAVAFLDTGGV